MKDYIKSFTLRLKGNTYEKIKTISEKSDRSINGQIEYILKKFIVDYEKFNEEIKPRE